LFPFGQSDKISKTGQLLLPKSEARHAATWVDARRPRVAAADAAAAAAGGAEDAAEARTAAGDVSDGAAAAAAAAADGVRHRIAEVEDSTVPRTRAISWL
jgi:hypothetical protein